MERYGLSVLLILIFFSIGRSEEYTKTFAAEIKTPDTPTILTNVPSSIQIEVNGTMHRSNTRDGFIITGKKDRNRLYINKDYNIETWDKNIVRQEIDITIRSKNKESAHQLLDQLRIELTLTADGQVKVDANMNLMKFNLSNGFFRIDKCILTLDDGSKHEVEYLELKTRLFIPTRSNLKVNSILHHTLRLGDLNGDLDLNIQYGEVYGKKINNLNANLNFCFNVIFDEADKVIASATNSHLKVSKVKHLELGKFHLRKGPSMIGNESQWPDSKSSMNLFNFRNVGKMIIHESANDKFSIGEIDDLEVLASIYSNYKILKLNDRILFEGKSGDISIAEVDLNFDRIDINNKLSQLNINISDKSNCTLNIFNHLKLESKIPSFARRTEIEGGIDLSYQLGEGKSDRKINIRCDQCELDIWD